MHRFYQSSDQIIDAEITLNKRESHHAINVLRILNGDRVVVLDGAGGEFMCEVVSIDNKSLRLSVRQQNKIQPLPFQITLLQAMTKGKSMDFIVQKATELCVHRIVPLVAEHSVVQVEDVNSKMEKWNSIAIDSIKQCGSHWLPMIESPVTPKEFLARDEHFDLALIASLQSHTQHPRKYVDDFSSKHGVLPESLAVWVGPEGDFTPAEVNDVLTAGVHPITLGQVILRSETAALYTVSVLNYEMQSPRD